MLHPNLQQLYSNPATIVQIKTLPKTVLQSSYNIMGDCLFNCYDTMAQTICNNVDALLGFAQSLKRYLLHIAWLVSQLVLDLSISFSCCLSWLVSQHHRPKQLYN